MKNWAILLAVTGLTGLEALVVFYLGTINTFALVLSVLSFITGITGIFLLIRIPLPGYIPQTNQTEVSSIKQEIAPPVTEKIPIQGNGYSEELEKISPVLIGEIGVYEKAIPSLFKSIVDYLNKTTEPMSESLVVIKTGMKDFIAQVQEHDQEIINSSSLDIMTGNVDKLQVDINLVAQKSVDAFTVFENKFKSLKAVLDSIFKLTGDISDIAERVHILSINASIESARAGVKGNGFKVIANEIQKLAHETQKFLKDIRVTADSSKGIFSSVYLELEDNKNSLTTMVHEEKETFNDLNEIIIRHYSQFKNLYSGILQFIKGLEGNMNDLFPLSMLHAIIIQEVENLDLVTEDFLKMLTELIRNHQGSNVEFRETDSIERFRKRLTTSRELDALEVAIKSLGLAEKIDLQRSNNDFELF